MKATRWKAAGSPITARRSTPPLVRAAILALCKWGIKFYGVGTSIRFGSLFLQINLDSVNYRKRDLTHSRV